MIEVALAAVPVLFLAVAARGQQGGASVSIAGTLLGIYWIGFAFAYAVLLRELNHGNAHPDRRDGRDLSGRHRGVLRRPVVRPAAAGDRHLAQQDRRGAVLRDAGGDRVGVSSRRLYSSPWLTHGDALILGVAIAILGPIGDLFESLVKRDAGAKDAGTLFGAHGGALDRLDAAIFTIVAAYFIYLAVH